MTARALRALPLLLSLALYGCVSGVFGRVKDHEAFLAHDLVCALPPPSGAGGNVNAAQSLTIQFGTEVFSFDAQIQITPERMDLVALDSLGRRAITIAWGEGRIESSQAPWFPKHVRPADVLADVAIVYFPEDAVASALSVCGASLTATASGRTVLRKNVDLIAVTYGDGVGWGRAAQLTNESLGFRIDIKSVDLAQ